jgi:hypothetical protein
MTHDYSKMHEFFKKNNFIVIKNFIDPGICNVFYQYCILQVQRTDYKIFHHKDAYNPLWDGKFGDAQVPNTYNSYADPLMESILISGKSQIENYIGLNLVPTYSYWRFYQNGDTLKRHRDRGACEISSTLCLGYNLGENYSEPSAWPIFVEGNTKTSDEPIPIDLGVGDILIYKGCEVDHWRDTFKGLNHAQAFLHYNPQDKEDNNYLDGRSILGIPNSRDM